MNVKTILNILSALLSIMGLSMLFPAFISWLFNEPDLLSFLYSSLCYCLAAPLILSRDYQIL